jgi:hypothetical protein
MKYMKERQEFFSYESYRSYFIKAWRFRRQFRQRPLDALTSTRKDAKDGAAGQCRASANSEADLDAGRRHRIPRGSGIESNDGLAHGVTKPEISRIVKNGDAEWDAASTPQWTSS